MFHTKLKKETTELDKAINLALIQLQTHESDSDEFAKIVKHLEKLHKMKPVPRVAPVSIDGMAAIAGNLIGIVMIMAFESEHVITTKALGFIIKPRI